MLLRNETVCVQAYINTISVFAGCVKSHRGEKGVFLSPITKLSTKPYTYEYNCSGLITFVITLQFVSTVPAADKMYPYAWWVYPVDSVFKMYLVLLVTSLSLEYMSIIPFNLGDREDKFRTHLIIILLSEVSYFPWLCVLGGCTMIFC